MSIRISSTYKYIITNTMTGDKYEGRRVKSLIEDVNRNIKDDKFCLSSWGVSMAIKNCQHKCYAVEKIHDPIKVDYTKRIPIEEQKKRG